MGVSMDLWMIGFWDAGILGDGWVNDIEAYINGYVTVKLADIFPFILDF